MATDKMTAPEHPAETDSNISTIIWTAGALALVLALAFWSSLS